MSVNKVGQATTDIVEVKFSNANSKINELSQKVQKKSRGPKSFKTVDHIQRYPLVQQTERLLNGFLITRIAIEHTVPVVKTVVNSKPVQFFSPLINVPDTVADVSLNVTEKIVPSLKTKTYQRLGEEAMIPCNFITKTNNSTLEFINNKITDPKHQAVKRWRVSYNQFIDSDDKPIIRGFFDPTFNKLNTHLEEYWAKSLQNDKLINKNSYCCEFDKSIVITINVMSDTVKRVNNKIISYPIKEYEYIKKVNDKTVQQLESDKNYSLIHSFKVLRDVIRSR